MRKPINILDVGALTRVLTITLGGSRKFILLNDKGVAVAESISDNALANWAFEKDVFEIRRDYDLKLGDD
jgi:hypothetical protein